MATATKQETKGLTLIEAIRQGIHEEMTRDESVFVIGEDIGAYGGAFKLTEGFIDEFGAERMIDTPISESGDCRRGVRRGVDGNEAGRGISVY